MSTAPNAATLRQIAALLDTYPKNERFDDWTKWRGELRAVGVILPSDIGSALMRVTDYCNPCKPMLRTSLALSLRTLALATDWQARRLRYADLTHSVLSLEQHEAHELLSQAMEGMGG